MPIARIEFQVENEEDFSERRDASKLPDETWTFIDDRKSQSEERSDDN